MADFKVPPHSNEAEASVLGAILIDKDAVISVAEFLRPEHFYDERNGKIYKAILDLYEERSPVDIVTLTDKLKKNRDSSKVGGTAYLTELINSVPTSANAEKYGQIIKDSFLKRELISASSKIVEVSFDEGTSAGQALDKAESAIFSLSQRHLRQSFIPIKEALAESFDRLDELHKASGGLRGVPTGFKDLDNVLAGLQSSNLLILAARPGIGKTALSLNIARSVSVDYKIPVGVFSLEMSKEELTDRLLVRQSEIDAWKLKTGRLEEEDFTQFSEAMGVLADAPLFVDDTPGISILEMRTKARRLQVEKGLKLLIVDYLQLIRGRNLENRVQEVSEISMGLKNLARELKIPIVCVSQLSRAVEIRGGSRPRLADLRESGCLAGETLVMNADTGERIPIVKLFNGEKTLPMKVLALDKDLKVKPFKMIKVFSSGKKKLFELKTKSGREIRASANHPFLKIGGWIPLENLKAGDFIAFPRILKISNNKLNNLNRDELALLAHLLGDGCILPDQPFHYISADGVNLGIVQKAAYRLFKINSRLVKQKNWFHLYLPSPFPLAPGRPHPITKWFKELGIELVHSWEKRIPEKVFNSTEEDIALFLKHLWSTDGNISWKCLKGRKPAGAIYYASSSELLVRQVQHLLLRLGIQTTFSKREDKRGNYRKMFLVSVQGAPNQLKFLEKVGAVGGKGEIIPKLIIKLKEIDPNPNNDIIPKEVWELVIKPNKEKLGLSWREFAVKMEMSYCGSSLFRNGISRERMERIHSFLKDKEIFDFATSDIYWDKIVSIKELGMEEVYDATMEGVHNFVANDIVVHNSIEQDADVVMFLYREDEENPENVTLEIAKHRNGPTAAIKLRFVGSRISFYPMDTKREK